jgi:hypothetical protein
MIANQSTLELKLEKLEQIKVKKNFLSIVSHLSFSKTLIRNLETQVDFRQELKQLENKISITSLLQNYNQCTEKRQQLLANAQVRFPLAQFNTILFFLGCIASSIRSR